MFIFGAAVGQKSIYLVSNPSEECKFQEYYLTQVKTTNFRSRVVGEQDICCLTQVRYNRLRLRNRKIFNKWDQ